MVKEDDGVKHDEQAKFIDSESVFARKIPDYQLSIWYQHTKRSKDNLFRNLWNIIT